MDGTTIDPKLYIEVNHLKLQGYILEVSGLKSSFIA